MTLDSQAKKPQSAERQSRFWAAALPYFLIAPTLLFVAVFTLWPLLNVAYGSLFAQNQAVQVRLADMSRRISGAQLMALQLARLKDAGTLSPAQVSMVKWNNCRMALDVARDCRDLLGGAGISAEYAPIRHMLNLESVITYEGTETIHQLAVGRELTGLNAF